MSKEIDIQNYKQDEGASTEPKDKAPAEGDEKTLQHMWAEAPEAGFDEDQVEIHKWCIAEEEEAENSLLFYMTLADAEELIYTAQSVAKEHQARAGRALKLAQAVSKRLGKTSGEINKTSGEIGNGPESGSAPKAPAPKAVVQTEVLDVGTIQ